MSLVRNEQTKLFANALDRMSTAFVTAGVLAPNSNVIFGGSRMNSLTLAALRLDIFRDRRCAPFAWPARAQGSARMTDFDFAIWFGIPCSVLVLAWVGVLRHERSAAKGATREVRRPNRSSQAIVPGVR